MNKMPTKLTTIEFFRHCNQLRVPGHSKPLTSLDKTSAVSRCPLHTSILKCLSNTLRLPTANPVIAVILHVRADLIITLCELQISMLYLPKAPPQESASAVEASHGGQSPLPTLGLNVPDLHLVNPSPHPKPLPSQPISATHCLGLAEALSTVVLQNGQSLQGCGPYTDLYCPKPHLTNGPSVQSFLLVHPGSATHFLLEKSPTSPRVVPPSGHCRQCTIPMTSEYVSSGHVWNGPPSGPSLPGSARHEVTSSPPGNSVDDRGGHKTHAP